MPTVVAFITWDVYVYRREDKDGIATKNNF